MPKEPPRNNFNVATNFNLGSHLLSGTGSIALSVLTMGVSDGVSFALDTAQIFAEMPGVMAEAQEVQSNFNIAMSDIILGNYH